MDRSRGGGTQRSGQAAHRQRGHAHQRGDGPRRRGALRCHRHGRVVQSQDRAGDSRALVSASVHAAGFGPPRPGIDLSGIGKGFSVDRVGERLRQLGVRDIVFGLGGEVIAGDGGWPVEIERPTSRAREISRTLTLQNRALTTSGNYHQPGHIIDPHTGKPVKRPASWVSVIANDCATADAWATTLFVLGPEFRGIPAAIEVTWPSQ